MSDVPNSQVYVTCQAARSSQGRILTMFSKAVLSIPTSWVSIMLKTAGSRPIVRPDPSARLLLQVPCPYWAVPDPSAYGGCLSRICW